MKVYDEPIDIRKKRDGSYTISLKVNDETLIVKTISKVALEQLKHRLMELTKE